MSSQQAAWPDDGPSPVSRSNVRRSHRVAALSSERGRSLAQLAGGVELLAVGGGDGVIELGRLHVDRRVVTGAVGRSTDARILDTVRAHDAVTRRVAGRIHVVADRDHFGRLVAHLGDGREADGKTNKPDNRTNPALFATPHAMCVDSHGDMYVVEWVDFGRARKFRHVKA